MKNIEIEILNNLLQITREIKKKSTNNQLGIGGQSNVLNFLIKQNSPVTQTYIAKELNISNSSTSTFIKKLHDKKLIRIEPSKNDKRNKLITLNTTSNSFPRADISSASQIFYKLNKSELEQLNRLLLKILDK